MKKLRKKYFLIISVVLSLFAFVYPFFIKNETFTAMLSLSFSAVSCVATILTLIIAIFLYDRFGLENKFVEKQSDKVLEFINILQSITINVKTTGFVYIVRFNRKHLDFIKDLHFYKYDRTKIILLSRDDFYLTMNELLKVSKSYWLPPEIKNNFKMFEFYGFIDFEDSNYNNYDRMSFVKIKQDKYWSTIPDLTFENFINNVQVLLDSIDKWLKAHSDIHLDLNL